VSFFADGPYHRNVPEALAFPDGYSFHRPFRYRDHYISDPVRKALGAHGNHVHGLRAVLAMRFNDETANRLILPVREIELTHAVITADANEIFFRLGRFFQVAEGTASLKELCLQLDAAVPHTQFMFALEGICAHRGLAADDDIETWSRLVELVAHDTSLPIAADARNSMFVRFQRPQRSQPAEARALYWSWREGWRYGARMPEGREMELGFLHRFPSNTGKNTTVKPFALTYEPSTADLAITPKQEEISGNYQSHSVVLQPLDAGSKLTDLQFNAPNDLPLVNGNEAHSSSYGLPVRVAAGFWHRLWSRFIPFIVVALALAANAVIGAYKDFSDHPERIAYVAIASLFASGVLYVSKR
jgi:hypothetical protein